MTAEPYVLTWSKAAAALGLALVMCWPIWVFDAQFAFADTGSYLRGGKVIWDILLDLIPTSSGGAPAVAGGEVTALTVDGGGQSTVGRSFPYSATAFAVQAVFGLWAIPVAMAYVVALYIVALVDKKTPLQWVGLGSVVTLTTLPWFAVYLIPDLFAAVPILFAALLVGPLKHAVGWQFWVYAGLAAVAVSFHYGFPPLMAGVGAVALGWLLVQRALTLRAVLAVVLATGFGPALNLAASSVVLDEPSTSPQRLPIPLARSLADGPARWYLQEVCPEAPLALCEAFGTDIPRNVPALLWAEDGVQSLPPDLVKRIRDEEAQVLWAAFQAYPWAQTRSLLGNVVRQLGMVGTKGIRAVSLNESFESIDEILHAPVNQFLSRIGPVLAWLTWLGAAPCLVLLLGRHLTREEFGMLALVLAGLLVNAAIFGGLSAPVERYQSRVIWLLPLVSALVVPAYLARRKRQMER